MDTKDKIRVMQAYVDGQTIESKFKVDGSGWAAFHVGETTKTPVWDWRAHDYRIKPVEVDVYFFRRKEDGQITTQTHAREINEAWEYMGKKTVLIGEWDDTR